MEKQGEIYKAMAAITASIGAVGKNGVCSMGPGRGFKYRSVDDVCLAVHPLLEEHGVFITPLVEDVKQEFVNTGKGGQASLVTLRVRYSFYCADGSHVDSVVCGEGLDLSGKAIGKAMSYAYKYCLLQTFCIPVANVDDQDKTTLEIKREERPAYRQVAARGGALRGLYPAWQEMFNLLRRKHNSDVKKMLADLSGFLGVEIRSVHEVNEEQAREFILAQKARVGEECVPF